MNKKPLIEKRLSGQLSEIAKLKRLLYIQRARLQILEGVTRVSEKFTSLRSLYDYYLDLILKITSTKAGSIILVDDVKVDHQFRKDLVYAACKGRGSERLIGKKIPAGEGMAGYVAKTGKAYFSKDVKKEKRFSTRYGEGTGFKAEDMICVPLKVSAKILGVVEVLDRKDKKPLTLDDLALLKSLAAQVAVLIENAHLLEKYKKKIKKLLAMEEVGRVLNSTLNEKEIRKRAMEAATRLMDAETGFLLLIDHEKGDLFFEVALGKKGRAVSEMRLKIGEGIAGWVAKTGIPVICNDVEKDPRHLRVDGGIGFKTRNMICTPVRIKGRVIGVLQAINKKKDGVFTKWDLDEFNTLANQVAIAIDNANLYKELRDTFLSTAEALADTMEARDAYTGGHTKRVLEYSTIIGEELSLREGDLENLKLAAVLHDIGKIGVEDSILRKDGSLTEEEDKVMKMHTIIGPRIVENVRQLRSITPGIRHHHETYDGRGYPDLLKGREIPVMARIISVADTFDAMTTDRPYRKGLPIEVALRELDDHAGIQFDARVVEAFIRAFKGGKVRLSADRQA